VVALSVVRLRTVRAWALVAAVAVAGVLVPRVPDWLPGAAPSDGPAALRQRVLDSADRPHQGYVEVQGTLPLPELPNLRDLTDLLSGTTRVRTWYAGPARWRYDVVSPVGERDVYGTPDGEYTWDYGAGLLTRLIGRPPVRLPRAGDLTPPELARRVLSAAAGDPVTALPGRRVAGRDTAGLRLTPRDPDTTIGHVDLWADPATGLPLAVEVTARGADRPVLTSRFLDVDRTRPAEDVLVPNRPPGSGYGEVAAPDLADALGAFGSRPLPARLAGRDLREADAAGVRGVGVYGAGLSAYVVVPVPGGAGADAADAIEKAGGTSEDGVTSLSIAPLSVVVARPARHYDWYLLAGLAGTDVLRAAARELTGGNGR
jgi:hypothetical protein